MDAFSQREAGFEKRMELDGALRFKALSRRNRRIAVWAADILGLKADDAEAYVRDFVAAEMERDDDEALTARLHAALAPLRPDLSAHRIDRRLREERLQCEREVFEGR